MEEKKEPKMLKLTTINEMNLPVHYSNIVNVNVNPFDVTLRFGVVKKREETDEGVQIYIGNALDILMSKEHAIEMYKVLEDVFKRAGLVERGEGEKDKNEQ